VSYVTGTVKLVGGGEVAGRDREQAGSATRVKRMRRRIRVGERKVKDAGFRRQGDAEGPGARGQGVVEVSGP
jgi:hypothetical protein